MNLSELMSNNGIVAILSCEEQSTHLSWLDDVGAYVVKLPQETFKNSGKVNTDY